MATTLLGMMILALMLVCVPMISGVRHHDLHHTDLMAGEE